MGFGGVLVFWVSGFFKQSSKNTFILSLWQSIIIFQPSLLTQLLDSPFLRKDRVRITYKQNMFCHGKSCPLCVTYRFLVYNLLHLSEEKELWKSYPKWKSSAYHILFIDFLQTHENPSNSLLSGYRRVGFVLGIGKPPTLSTHGQGPSSPAHRPSPCVSVPESWQGTEGIKGMAWGATKQSRLPRTRKRKKQTTILCLEQN